MSIHKYSVISKIYRRYIAYIKNKTLLIKAQVYIMDSQIPTIMYTYISFSKPVMPKKLKVMLNMPRNYQHLAHINCSNKHSLVLTMHRNVHERNKRIFYICFSLLHKMNKTLVTYDTVSHVYFIIDKCKTILSTVSTLIIVTTCKHSVFAKTNAINLTSATMRSRL